MSMHDYYASLSPAQQMALMRQPYDSDDSGVPLPVFKADVEVGERRYLAFVKGEYEKYRQCLAWAGDENLANEDRLAAYETALFVIQNLATCGPSGDEIARLMSSKFEWREL